MTFYLTNFPNSIFLTFEMRVLKVQTTSSLERQEVVFMQKNNLHSDRMKVTNIWLVNGIYYFLKSLVLLLAK